MKHKKLKYWTSGEIRFALAGLLKDQIHSIELITATRVARIIYADIIAPALEEERELWEEATRAKDRGLT